LDAHKLLIFYFKIAWLYMGAGKPNAAIDYLNQILNHPGKALREDMQAYASILFIMAHYDLKNTDFLTYEISNTNRFIRGMKDPSLLLKASIGFFRRLINAKPDDLKKQFLDFREQLSKLKQNDYEKRSFIFLDIESWVESKIQNKTLAAVVKERYERRLVREINL
jgi:tetratricopeptide (TPR) repeat protein